MNDSEHSINAKALSFFERMATSGQCNQNSVKLAKNSDYSDMDVAFLRKYTTRESTVLDLGAGTGLIVNKLYPHVKNIVAVEPFTRFTRFIAATEGITVVHQTVSEFTTTAKFELISLFGLMHYVDESQAKEIYTKYIKYLKREGVMIIKNQFGLTEDITINGYSEELQENYSAQYRQIDEEVRLLREAGFGHVAVVDIYPKECNRWNNTHFFALVAAKQPQGLQPRTN